MDNVHQLTLDFNEPTPHLCECGCGQPTPIAKVSAARRGHVKGQPTRFIQGHTSRRKPPQQRFWAKVDRSGGPNACWLWLGATAGHGYGVLNVNHRMIYAHRFSFELHFGAVPDEQLVRHNCDNPPCVNPAHLIPGNVADNSADAVARGLQPKGEQLPHTRLTEALVRTIRERHLRGDSSYRIAKDLGVSWHTVRRVVLGESWAHVK